jgi:transcriptional regulator with XRE-family HTH domain
MIPWRECFPQYTPLQINGISLSESRHLMNLSQKQLSKLSGISVKRISQYENGKMAITENVAKIFAKELNTDYRIFIS